MKIDNASGTPPANLVLCNSTGLNRKIEPIYSRAVFGAGWANAASVVAYANSQQYFEGGMSFELQYNTTIWNLFAGWLTTARVTPLSVQISPDGFENYLYQYASSDPQSGVWLRNCSMTISPEASIKVDCTGVALKRAETVTTTSNYAAFLGTNLSLPSSFTNSLMNPSPFNRNPIPGWYAQGGPVSPATQMWPNAPTFWALGTNYYGVAMLESRWTADNKTQVVRGCTGQPNPIAVLQGTMEASGDVTLWRDGSIKDPYGDQNNPSTFTATAASIGFTIAGGASQAIQFNNIVLQEDTFNVAGQDDKIPRVFGFFAIGNGSDLPVVINALS